MDRMLFLFMLFTAITPLVLSMPRKYFLIQQYKTWSDARAYCQSNYNDLALIDSNANMDRIKKEAQMQKFTGLAWGGLYVNFQSYHWSYGFQPLGSFNLWLPGEPDNWGGYFQCATIALDGWRDTPCDYILNFVCFDDRFTNSSRLIYYPILMTWRMAQVYCRQYHTDLAMARNVTENSAILATGVSKMTWFGLSRDNLYWVDPTIVPPLYMAGKPDGFGVENCGLLYNGLADDERCSVPGFFYCYSMEDQIVTCVKGSNVKREKLLVAYYTEKKKHELESGVYYPLVRIKQTVRFMIKSDQDVIDSNLKAAILEKIQLKLQEFGLMQNITLRWNTFYKNSQDSNSLPSN